MAKTATKRKEHSAASIKRRFTAALVMLLVSSVMLVTSTYAWFTLSTAPEVRGIATSVTGNGSLELALMPYNGQFTSIGTGRNASGSYAGGNQDAQIANTNWGNIINLSSEIYGLEDVELKPAKINLGETGSGEYVKVNGLYVDSTGTPIQSEPGDTYIEGKSEADRVEIMTTDYTKFASTGSKFSIPEFGYDGRITELVDTYLKSHYTTVESDNYSMTQGFAGTSNGVRAIVDDDGQAYGYVIDFAVRINATNITPGEGENPSTSSNGKLLLQVAGAQRIYSDSTAANTQGGGSNFTFKDDQGNELEGQDLAVASEYMKALKIAFVKNLGNSEAAATDVEIIGYAKVDPNTGDLYLCNGNGTSTNSNVIIESMAKNTAYQISAIVWLDGEDVTNANMAINNNVLKYATLNLQFATDVTLKPAQNTNLRDNPPGPNTPAAPTVDKSALQTAIQTATNAYVSTSEDPAQVALGSAITTAQAVYDNNDATAEQVAAQVQALTDAIAAVTPNP